MAQTKEEKKEYAKKWRKENSDKTKEYRRKYYKENLSKFKEYQKNNPKEYIGKILEYQKKNRVILSDVYIKKRLISQGFVKNQITPELIELKRITLKTKRLCLQLKS